MNFDLNLGALDEGKLIKLNETELYDVLIVGTGPAAVASAVYAVRKGLKTAMKSGLSALRLTRKS